MVYTCDFPERMLMKASLAPSGEQEVSAVVTDPFGVKRLMLHNE
ncbi:MAG: hypothetical protein ACREOQ_00705 [Gemmatimonadales bacterium]